MYNVQTMGTKEDRLHTRIRPDVKEEGLVVAELRGLTLSALIQHLLLKAIHEEKKANPIEFGKVKKRLADEAARLSRNKIRKAG